MNTPMPGDHPYFAHDDHAFLAGLFIGHLMSRGLDIKPESDEDGNYTDVIAVDIPRLDETGFWTIRLRVLPPDQGRNR